MRRVASVPAHPLGLAAAFVFAAYLDADVSFHAALRPFLVVMLAVALVVLAAVWLFGPRRGPILVTIAVLLVRSTDPLRAGNALLIGAAVLLAWVAAHRMPRTLAFFHDPNRLLNSVTVVLVAATMVTATATGTLARIDLEHGRPFSTVAQTDTLADPGRPDIYLILLDGYPRADTLERLFQFDNAAFVSNLEERGFVVAEESRSNYMFTVMTFMSLLHMKYVHEIPGSPGIGPNYGVSLRALVNRNPVWDELKSRGYLIAANQSPWETVGMRNADLFCGDYINDFEMHLLGTTWVGPVVDALNPSFRADRHRDIINQAFDCLAGISAPTTSPKFVFAHVGGPHFPVVFTRTGAAASLDVFGETTEELQVTVERLALAYREEIEYLNGRVLEFIDRLASRPDQPIVIVMSDHGSELGLHASDSSRSDLRERFSNFLAARTPAQPSLFPSDMTPVNLFPILFEAYFDEKVALHEPRFFLSAIHNELLFTEIPDPAPPSAVNRFDEQSGPA